MLDPLTGTDPIPVRVDGVAIDAWDATIHLPSEIETAVGLGRAEVRFVVGAGEPVPIYRIGHTVTLQYDERDPAPFQVIELSIHQESQEREPLYEVRLREVEPSPDPPYDVALLYDSVFETIVNRLRGQSVLDLLVEKGVFTESEYRERLRQVAEERAAEFARQILSEDDTAAVVEVVRDAVGAPSEGVSAARFASSGDASGEAKAPSGLSSTGSGRWQSA